MILDIGQTATHRTEELSEVIFELRGEFNQWRSQTEKEKTELDEDRRQFQKIKSTMFDEQDKLEALKQRLDTMTRELKDLLNLVDQRVISMGSSIEQLQKDSEDTKESMKDLTERTDVIAKDLNICQRSIAIFTQNVTAMQGEVRRADESRREWEQQVQGLWRRQG